MKMRLLDSLRGAYRDRRDQDELQSLIGKFTDGAGDRRAALAATPFPDLAGDLLDFEGVYSSWSRPQNATPADIIQLTGLLKHLLSLREGGGVKSALSDLLEPLATSLPTLPQGEDFGLSVSVLERLRNPAAVVEGIVRAALKSPFRRVHGTVRDNLLIASKIDPAKPSNRPLVLPTAAKVKSPEELVKTYLNGTPFTKFFDISLPYAIPYNVRFEHSHIVGGSGHGKTQLLQTLIMRDLEKLKEGKGSLIVIDSQGDLLRNILSLSVIGEISDRLVLIDPNDIEYPPCLNLFDFGLERTAKYSPVEREKLINGAIALYEYLFGALLGAELTMRQGVIFRYLARLMMVVPGGTIHTFMDFMENPDATHAYFGKLDRLSRHFFETQFPSPAFKDTRQQILARLWGVLSNSVLERMFANPQNKLDLFHAMNNGSLILINTAKDLLKQEGCEILGRFFIALVCQAAQERASIPEDKRQNTFLYIDEAHDYFDQSMENLLNQARKYKVGLVLAHQNLDQFKQKLRSTVMSSTSLKLVGGLSASDANAFAKEMHCERDYLQGMSKHEDCTEFACFVRNHTPAPIRLTVPFGTMEASPRLPEADYAEILTRNRVKYAAGDGEQDSETKPPSGPSGFELGKPEVF
jgi:hypothetical protein